MKNILQVADTSAIDSVTVATEVSSNTSLWFWVAVLEFIIILFLLIKSRNKKGNETDEIKQKLKRAKDKEVDMDSLMMSINSSKTLYKEMSRVCHPDRFSDDETKKVAEAIFQEITRHKRDYKKLKELMSEAETKLNVKFKK